MRSNNPALQNLSQQEACYFGPQKNVSLSSVKSLTGAQSASSSCNPNVTKGGVACVDLGGLVNGTITETTYIRNAGAFRVNMTEMESPFDMRRSHKRGTKYDASIANYPENSVAIILMETMETKCFVQLNDEPYTVVYAPLNATVLQGVGPPPVTSGTNTVPTWGASLVIMAIAFVFV